MLIRFFQYTGFEGFEYRNQQTGANDYVRKHNPAVLYDSVSDLEDRLSKIKNLTEFEKDLEADALPQWMFITPNMTSDGMFMTGSKSCPRLTCTQAMTLL